MFPLINPSPTMVKNNVALDQEHDGEDGVYMGALSVLMLLHHHHLALAFTAPITSNYFCNKFLTKGEFQLRMHCNALLRSYHRSFNRFAENLTDTEAPKLSAWEDTVSVFPSKMLQPHTTHSWDFAKRNPTIESDIIIGVIDTGILPESISFTDNGFLDLPKKWSCVCQGGFNFTCNRKLIGARYYTGSSARDTQGHGTHTASIAAGNVAKDASFFGLAGGNARGGVPSARLAVYKVCSGPEGCTEEYVLTAFDDAIADGVDLISISMGSSEGTYSFLRDWWIPCHGEGHSHLTLGWWSGKNALINHCRW